MPKHPVPKQKQSKTRSKKRYSAYRVGQQTRLKESIQLVDCSNCLAPRRVHHVCKACGMYRGRQVLDIQKKMKKITTIQA